MHCTHHAAPFHSGIPRIKLSFYFPSTILHICIQNIPRSFSGVKLTSTSIYLFVADENVCEQIPHCVNVANVFFTCMRFLRIAYPNLLLEMCVHGGMLAHFSTYNVSFFYYFKHNWHERGHFYPLVLFGFDFVS